MKKTSDKFENWVAANRERLDKWETPDSLWEKVKKNLDSKENEEDAFEKFVKSNRAELDAWEVTDKLWGRITENLPKKDEERFETWVNENRSDFDRWEVPKHLWKKIQNSLHKEGEKVFVIKQKTIWRVAAVVALLITFFGIGFIVNQNFSENSNIVLETSKKPDLEKISPELAEAEKYYSSIISEKQEKIKTYSVSDADLQATLEESMQHLDSIYQGLKVELASQNEEHRGRVVQAMVENLKMRIEILNRQLILLERIEEYQKTEKNNENEEISI